MNKIGMSARQAAELSEKIKNEQQGKLFAVSTVIIHGSVVTHGNALYRVDGTDMHGNHHRFNSEYYYEQWKAENK